MKNDELKKWTVRLEWTRGKAEMRGSVDVEARTWNEAVVAAVDVMGVSSLAVYDVSVTQHLPEPELP